MNDQPVNRNIQRICGLFISLLSLGFVIWSWKTALTEHYFHVKSSVIFPGFIVLGLGLIFFPGYKEERINRGEDLSKLKPLQTITLRWWVIIFLGLVAGIINLVLIKNFT